MEEGHSAVGSPARSEGSKTHRQGTALVPNGAAPVQEAINQGGHPSSDLGAVQVLAKSDALGVKPLYLGGRAHHHDWECANNNNAGLAYRRWLDHAGEYAVAPSATR